MIDNAKNTGLTPVRTARLIACVIALVGMVFLFLERLLSAVLVMASAGVKLGLARYNNFTGRFASQNFAEDKQLLSLLKEVQGLLPSAESALTVFMVVAIVLLVIAVIGLALPRQFVHVLVALKLLKWQSGEVVEGSGANIREVLDRVGNVPLKKLAVPFAVILAIVVAVFAIHSCQQSSAENSVTEAFAELNAQAGDYIAAQKAYFSKNKALGNAKALQMSDSVVTDYFIYRLKGTRFSAESRAPFANCPAGSKWSVHSNTKGFFEKEITFFRMLPKDTACVKLSIEFKNVGRNGVPQKPEKP